MSDNNGWISGTASFIGQSTGDCVGVEVISREVIDGLIERGSI